jgi:hypothetical protein
MKDRYEELKRKLTDHELDGVENLADAQLRNKNHFNEDDYMQHFLKISRMFGYATHDDSWGEFEKEFAIMVNKCSYLGSLVSILDEPDPDINKILDMCSKIKERWGKI